MLTVSCSKCGSEYEYANDVIAEGGTAVIDACRQCADESTLHDQWRSTCEYNDSIFAKWSIANKTTHELEARLHQSDRERSAAFAQAYPLSPILRAKAKRKAQK